MAEVRPGDTSPLTAETVNAAGIGPGDEASPEALRAARMRALLFLRGRGYLDATLRLETEPAQNGVLLHVAVQPGSLYHFGRTSYKGQDKLPVMVLERERTYADGDPYDRRKLFDTRRQLFLTGLFEDIRVDASTTTERTADVMITVRERPLKWIKGGFGWGSEESQRVTLQLIHENLFRRAYKGEFTTQWSRIWLETRADLVTRYFFKTRTQLKTSLGWRQETREGYSFERTMASATFGRSLWRQLTGSAGYQVERNVTFNVNPQIAALTPSLSDSRSLVAGLEWEGANDLFFPTDGVRARIRGQRAGGGLGGTIHFNKVSGEVKLYEALGQGWVGAIAFRGGVASPFLPSTEVPIFDRFFTGGANSVRGYRERGVGPKDNLGDPLGGTWTGGSSVELRFPLFWRFMGAAFVDGGTTALSRREALPSEWKYSTGGGLRLKTPVGPIRLDYGYKLNPAPDDRDLWRLHLSLGEAF